MERDTLYRFVLPAVVVLIVIISVVIFTGLASENPDGFEWALFEWAGVSEPESGYSGLFAFLGEGPAVDVLTGSIGIILVLVLAYAFFKYTSRNAE